MINREFPRYVESDLVKAKIIRPPRNRKKEVDIYLYETNQDIILVESTDSSLSIQAKFNTPIKFQSTTPLNFDIGKPKFKSVSETSIWGSQLNGFLYQDLNLDPDKYNFITFSVILEKNIKQIAKYRIVNNDRVFSNDNEKFLYSSVSFVLDSIKTIKSLKKFNWQLVQEFQADTKTKYIKLEFDPKTILFGNGIKISVLPEKGQRPINDGYKINYSSIEFVSKLIKFRQTNPIEIDDLTLSDLSERTVKVSDSHKKYYGYIGGEKFLGFDVDIPFDISILPEVAIAEEPNYGRKTIAQAVNQLNYFSRGLKLTLNNGSSRLTTLKENNLSLQQITQWLNGTFSFDGELIEKSNTLNIIQSLQKITDLDKDKRQDKLYFVLSKKSNLTKYLVVNFWTAAQKVPFPKTRLLTEEEWGRNFISNDPIVIELELQAEGFSPKIEINSSLGRTVKITNYDKNHNIIGTPELNFQTEFSFNDSKIKTTIQL